MQNKNDGLVPHWTSRWIFVLAATGAAVGLGNFWKFPYLVNEAGGAFVVIYLAFLITLALPLLLAELTLGRAVGQNPIFATRSLAEREASMPNPLWRYLGWAMTVTGVLILSYYSVVAGWILAYTLRTAIGIFESVDNVEGIRSIFALLLADPEKMLAWHTIFILMAVCISGRDFRRGVENAVKFVVPTMFILLVILVLHSATTQTFRQSLLLLADFDFSKLTFTHVMLAMQHAFFSLSLGAGVMMVYGAYLDKTGSIFSVSASIILLDTVAALLAVCLMYPIVSVAEVDIASGVTLVFQTLPMAFKALPGGAYWGTLFFLTLVLAAWTSAIALLEPPIAWLTATFGWRRAKAAIFVGLIVWFLGLFNILSLNYWAFEFRFFGAPMVNGWLDILSLVTSTILLPLIALLVAVFSGWILSREYLQQQMGLSFLGYTTWNITIRFAVPCLIIVVFIYSLLY